MYSCPPSGSPPAGAWAWTPQGPSGTGSRYPHSPELCDVSLPLLHLGGSGLPQLQLHPTPGVFNRVQVRAVPWPLDQGDVGPVLEPLGNLVT